MPQRLSFVAAESGGLHVWEPVVDGRLLRHLLTDTPGDPTADWVVGPSVASVLTHSWPSGMPEAAYVLLGERPSPLANGRVPIFVCQGCGDPSCNAVTAAMTAGPDTVSWSDLAWETDEPDTQGVDPVLVGPLVFDRREYEAEIRRFVDTFDEVRASLPDALAPRRSPENGRRSRRRRPWWPFS